MTLDLWRALGAIHKICNVKTEISRPLEDPALYMNSNTGFRALEPPPLHSERYEFCEKHLVGFSRNLTFGPFDETFQEDEQRSVFRKISSSMVL